LLFAHPHPRAAVLTPVSRSLKPVKSVKQQGWVQRPERPADTTNTWHTLSPPLPAALASFVSRSRLVHSTIHSGAACSHGSARQNCSKATEVLDRRSRQAQACPSFPPSSGLPVVPTKLRLARRSRQAQACPSFPPSSGLPVVPAKLRLARRSRQAQACPSGSLTSQALACAAHVTVRDSGNWGRGR